MDVCVVTGVRDAAGVAEKWAQGRTTPGPHAGERGYPELGLTITNVQGIEKAPHAVRITPEGAYGCAVDLQFQLEGVLLAGDDQSELDLYAWMGELADAAKLVWGGCFKKRDLAHIELPNFHEYPLPAAGVA